MNSIDDDYYMNTLRNVTLYLYKYAFVVFYIISNIGNLLSALVFCRKSWKKNVCVFYFKVCLVVRTGYINSNALGLILFYGFNINFLQSNVFLCKAYFYASFLFSTLSTTILILASIDRLLISSQNVDTRLYSSKRLAYFSIGLNTIFWILFFCHILIKVDIYEVYPFYSVCYYDASISYLNFVTYSMAIINGSFSVSMIILCALSFKNVRRIRAAPREKRTQQVRTMNKKDFQLLRCLFAHGIVYIIFGTIINGYYVYTAITKGQHRTQLEQAIVDFSDSLINFLYSASYSSSFFIFLFVSKAFRYELKRILYNIIGKNINPMREEENRQENVVPNNVELNVVSNIA